ncbi:histidine kinase [Pedobacter sp. ISL-68]|uniref:histidine kinase n=1 Tax=unclassified Pedobacter TaxID=2628915 RepID=UPI001BE8E340|nr:MULTISPECIES: histidine kinase [unclassified Pedobacter]MBT2561312.1 histidine kinase [Pedobacter sp. ISL-64]MBT2590701.1 histidine kinase [Pedobacter sp. ISL-68]
MKVKSLKPIALHLLIISLFVCYEISVVLFMRLSVIGVQYFLPYYVPDLLLFYVNALLIMHLWRRGNKSVAILLILLELLCHFGIYLAVDNMVNHRLLIETKTNDYIRISYRSIYVFGISLTYWLVMRNKKQAQEIYDLRLQALELQNRQVVLENAYLRSKANPHLTFNVLDVLYGNLEKKMPDEATVVKLLTDTMDYAIAGIGDDGKVTLGEEIEHVKKIIALYQFLNLNLYPVQFTIEVSDDDKQLRVPPLILATLVDNIFMHGYLTDKECPATIILACNNNKLSLHQSNAIAKRERGSHGLGLAFVRNCLAFYYADRSELAITVENNIYAVNLSIDL